MYVCDQNVLEFFSSSVLLSDAKKLSCSVSSPPPMVPFSTLVDEGSLSGFGRRRSGLIRFSKGGGET